MQQLGVTQEEFLGSVAKALGRSKPLSTAPKRLEVGPPAFWREDEPIKKQTVELFTKNLEGLSGRVFLANNADDANNKINEWLQELNAKKAICWRHTDLEELLQPENLSVELYYWDASQKSAEELKSIAATAEVGITWINYGIAYTGTMALFSSPQTARSVSLLPPTHIGILKRSQLVPTMSYVMRKMTELKGANNLPSAINFITGPSRTSDIEMDLSIGVHGPYRTWVIILDKE